MSLLDEKTAFTRPVGAASARAPVRPAEATGGIPLPREHGAWGLLLQPFVASVIVARQFDWLLLPALALALLGFVLREPLVVLSRQRWVWRTRNPQSSIAARWVAWELAGISVCLVVLGWQVPIPSLIVLTAVALALTLVAVWCTVKNLQRSIPLQIVSTAGLGSTALLVALVLTGTFPAWAWQLWALLTMHAVATILVVHARLRSRVAARTGEGGSPRAGALAAQGVQFVSAAVLAVLTSAVVMAVPLVFSALVNTLELLRLSSGRGLTESLTRVGYRTLAVSLVHMGFAIAVLWAR